LRRPIVFVTDYGRDDTYAASLIGGALRIQPQAVCIEGTHGVPPGDVLAGAYHLKALALAFDRDVVLCAVVDPNVGTPRRCIAIEVERLTCVAPDNGLISYLWDEAPDGSRWAVDLPVPDYAWPTFHGRDVFAPAAAQLAAGDNLDSCGESIDDPITLSEAFAQSMGTGLAGRIAVVDHFGNAITTIRATDVEGRAIRGVSWSGGATSTVVTTYDDIPPGTVAALVGSAGHVEIATRGQAVVSLGGPGAHAEVTVDLG
jgi:S-adenosyl-L-methionine hydrolase (adenosine-forming)